MSHLPEVLLVNPTTPDLAVNEPFYAADRLWGTEYLQGLLRRSEALAKMPEPPLPPPLLSEALAKMPEPPPPSALLAAQSSLRAVRILSSDAGYKLALRSFADALEGLGE